MPAQRARMKAGHRPIIIECMFVPEYPAYWHVPESASAGVALLVADGQVEYEPSYTRGAHGAFAPEPALQVVSTSPARPAPPAKAFQRKGR